MEECIVKDCTNKKHEGEFVGDICGPCYKIITEGNLDQPSNNFIHKLAKRNNNLKSRLDRINDISNVVYMGYPIEGDYIERVLKLSKIKDK